MSQDNFVWTDALVAEYSLTNQKMTLFEFKRFVQEREEKTKRDWEILALKRWDGVVIEKSSEPRFDILSRLEGYVIYTVCRKSDSEVFSIGDEVKYSISGDGFNGKINEFETYDGRMMARGEPHAFCFDIKHLQKPVKPKPLFVTEDGVEIFAHLHLPAVDISEYRLTQIHTNSVAAYDIREGKGSIYKVFSTKDKAEEHLLLNKPLLSVDDIFNDTKPVGMMIKYGKSMADIKNVIVELAKQKLSK